MRAHPTILDSICGVMISQFYLIDRGSRRHVCVPDYG